jgi:hypothetical protein
MKINFDNPCPGATSFDESGLENRLKFYADSGVKVVSPYKGVVNYVSRDSVHIMHEVTSFGTTIKVESDFFNINSNVVKGQKVSEGEKIGETTGKDMIFEIVFLPNSVEDKVPEISAKKVIGGGYTLKNDEEKILKRSKNSENGYNKPKNNPDDILRDIFKIALAPASFVQGAFGWDDKTVKEHLVKENVKNIKRLM